MNLVQETVTLVPWQIHNYLGGKAHEDRMIVVSHAKPTRVKDLAWRLVRTEKVIRPIWKFRADGREGIAFSKWKRRK